MQRAWICALAALITINFFNVASAETTAVNSIKYRHAVMESLGNHIEALSMMAFNKVDKNEYFVAHAEALAKGTAEIKTLFPAGSGDGETEALPAVWDDPEQFAEAAQKAEDAFAALLAAVKAGDGKSINGAFATAGKSCKGCHETFRAEHDH
jgi:cytochrome c556